MISDFIDEYNGCLSLTKSEYDRAKVTDPSIRMHARERLEYGEAKEGYWTSDKFMVQLEMAVKRIKSSILKRRGGITSGYSTTAAAMERWLRTSWT